MTSDEESSKSGWYRPVLKSNPEASDAFLHPLSPQPSTKTIDLSIGAKPRAGLADFHNLIGASPARIVMFEFAEPLDTTQDSHVLLEAVWQANSRCIEANPSFSRAFGFSNVDDVLGLSLAQFYPRSEMNREMFRQWIDNGFFLARFSSSGKNSAGFSISLQTAVYSNLHDEEIDRIWIVSRDVSDLMSALTAAKREEEHYRTMVERPGLVLVRARPDGSYSYITPHVEDIVGYTVQDFFNDPRLFRNLLHPDDRERHDAVYQARAARSSKPVEMEFRVLCKDGTYHWFFERMIPKFDRNGRVEFFDSIAFDIQERKQLEAELFHAQRMEIMGNLAGGIAHDFNNHLTGILGQITLAQEELPADHPAQLRLRAAEKAADTCSEMTKRLLGLGRKADSLLSNVDVDLTIRQTVDLLRHVLPASISVKWQPDGILPPVCANAAQLQQVIMNLAVNSRDAMQEGGELVISGKAVSPDDVQPYVEIKVIDNGKGIPADILPHIFEPFFTTKGPGQGTGLGLSSVKTIVEAWHGIITSESDAGACFTFTIPVSDIGVEPVPLSTREPLHPGGTESILVIDDDPLVRAVVNAALTLKGYSVIEAASGDDALAQLNNMDARPDAAIIDKTMPGVSGVPLALKLKDKFSGMQFIISSGYWSEHNIDDESDGAGRGMNFLPKPFTLAELYKMVRTTLDSKN